MTSRNLRVDCAGEFDASQLFALVFEHRFDLLAQLGRVLVPVRGHGVFYCRVENFAFPARDFQRTILFARVIPAID